MHVRTGPQQRHRFDPSETNHWPAAPKLGRQSDQPRHLGPTLLIIFSVSCVFFKLNEIDDDNIIVGPISI
ncbi:hypothetical protein L484_003735 [Morus notabilis]|uniref:Uncharacterized protein n=1 Tax=Morus notabilis TaxID=981085 RepID=W9RMV4_9ROSA|nr:hypothetical protein L484_003735 [Morus notabilis]